MNNSKSIYETYKRKFRQLYKAFITIGHTDEEWKMIVDKVIREYKEYKGA